MSLSSESVVPNQDHSDVLPIAVSKEEQRGKQEVLRVINEIGVTGIESKFGKSPIGKPSGDFQTITKFDEDRNVGNFIRNYRVFNFVSTRFLRMPTSFDEFFDRYDYQVNHPVAIDPKRYDSVLDMGEIFDNQLVGERIGITRLPKEINIKKQIGVEKKFLAKTKPIYQDVAIPVNAGTELVKCPDGMKSDRVCLIGYLAGGKLGFEGGKADHRGGNILRAWALVPESIALEVNKLLDEDPGFAREFAESVVKDVLISRGGNPADWDNCKTGVASEQLNNIRPPYEDWAKRTAQLLGGTEGINIYIKPINKNNNYNPARIKRAPVKT